MVDNVTANAGSGGATFATDDDGTAHHPYTKIEWGADNTQTKVDTGTGAMPVQGADAENAAVTANPVLAAGRYDSSARTLGDGDVGSFALSASGHVIVDTLPAGTNAIGKLAANSGVDIGDVDVTSVIPGTGATNLGKAEDAAHSTGDTGVMPLAVRRDIQTASSGTDGDYEPLQTDAFGGLRTTPYEPPGRTDVFGRSMIASANNDIDIQFFRGDPDTLVQVTTANSATATANIGGALFASSTDANGSVQGVTRQKTVYRSGSEIYCMFTASFTAGIASSVMRLGLYDASNGFFVGYEGTSFGVTYRNNGSDTTVAKGSFSEDTLTGAAGSRFTRAGVPEAIDLTKLNIFRIRFGWLGSAPAYWEVMAPDGHWVIFHKTLFPNLQANPSIRDADLPMTIDITKTAAAATDLQIQTDCWGAGATLTEQSGIVDSLNSRFASTLSAGTSWNAAGPWVDVHRYALSKILIYSSTNNASGTLQVEFSMDGSTVHRTINYGVDNANTHPPHVLVPVAQFMRVSYDADAGGGNNHADFTIQTIHHVNANKLPTSKVTSTLGDNTDVDNVRAVIAGENPAAGGSYVNVRVDSSGQIQCDIAADSVGLGTEATLGAVQTAVELIDDAVYVDDADWTAATSKHLLTGGVYNSTPRTVTDGDTAPFAMDVNGHIITSAHAGSVVLADNVSNTANIMVDESDAFMASATFGYFFDGTAWDRLRGDATDGLLVNLGTNNDVQGDVAHDSADSGNPIKIGAKAETSLSGVTLVADGDRVDLAAGVDGVLITRPHANLEDLVDGNASDTAGTSTQVIAAAGAGIKQYLLSATITNTSATDTYCEIKSGTTVKWTVPVPANGGVTLQWPAGLKPNAANEAWNFDMGAAVTTAYCSMSGFKSKV